METKKLIAQYSKIVFDAPVCIFNKLNADLNGYCSAFNEGEEIDVEILKKQIKTVKSLIKAHKQLNVIYG